MIGVQYSYNPPNDILKGIDIIRDFGVIEYSILAAIFLVFILITFYLIPGYFIILENWKNEKDKLKKKALIRQIALQKDIEDEIERELNIK